MKVTEFKDIESGGLVEGEGVKDVSDQIESKVQVGEGHRTGGLGEVEGLKDVSDQIESEDQVGEGHRVQ